MHELGILSSMMNTIEDIMKDEALTHIEAVVLQVGEISGVVPRYLDECWPAAVYKSQFEDTKLELEVIPGIVRCNECGRVFNAVQFDLKCPDCKSENHFPLGGREFIIKEIRGY